MNSLLDNDTEDELDDRPARRDREITLGTTVVLGIFFALAAYGAVLFGFGYSMGAKHNSAVSTSEPGAATSFGGSKPAPGSPLGASSGAQPKPQPGPTVTVPDTPAPAVVALPARPVPQPQPQNRAPSPASPGENSATATAPASPARPQPALASVPELVQPGAAGSFLVQVAAVSHQEDADLLVVTLKRRGYPVTVRHEPQDALLHVQIGNFINKKDADAMRQRLLADGFNAIVK